MTVEQCRREIARRNTELNAVLTVLPEPSFDAAAQKSGELAGVPYVLKDVWDTEGIRTTGGSWRHRARVPSASGRPYEALRRAGAVLLGKSNLCDLAFSAESDNHILGPVRNPLDPARTAGGSTGGGAAAVAAKMAAFDWGTDFGGSIRMPAAFCGVVGLRLSASVWRVDHDHFPRLHPHFWPFCGMGPLTRDVASAYRIVRALAPFLREADASAMKSGDGVVVWGPDATHLGEWPTFVSDAVMLLGRAGVPYEMARLPSPEHVHNLFGKYLASHFDFFIDSGEISFAEGMPAVLVGLATRGRIDKRVHPNTGKLFVLLAIGSLLYRDKARAEDGRAKLREAIEKPWKEGRLVITPTATESPPRHGRAARAMRLGTFCQLGNLVDATAIAVPFGRFETTGMPRSIQILGPPGSEERVLALAERLEQMPAHS
jgi:Asp-tRNA(Asn)/Glu-tRNA(Gln) amidotransferase A subunit family amidase